MDYVGIPFADRGRDRQTGMDCWGLVRHWYAEQLGIDLPGLLDAPSYGHEPEKLPALIARETRAWRRVDRPQPGDLVVVRIGERPFHVGVYVGEDAGVPMLLHTMEKTGSVKCDLSSPMWAPRIEGYYRHV